MFEVAVSSPSIPHCFSSFSQTYSPHWAQFSTPFSRPHCLVMHSGANLATLSAWQPSHRTSSGPRGNSSLDQPFAVSASFAESFAWVAMYAGHASQSMPQNEMLTSTFYNT